MASDYADTLQRLCHHLRQLSDTEAEISPQTDLINELSIDSVKLLNLVMEIEDEFDISVPLNVLADVQTVHDLASLIHQLKAASQ